MTLLRRDPWLASQTLMQLLYLRPARPDAWRPSAAATTTSSAGPGCDGGGQLARPALAWLAISGEDAPDFSSPPRRSRPTGSCAQDGSHPPGSVALVFAPFSPPMALPRRTMR